MYNMNGINDPTDEVIELNFGKYWKACTNTRLSIRAILAARRFGARIEDLPKEVQEKIRQVAEA